jgi:hypothetical protein
MNDPGRSQNVASDLGSSDAHALKSTTQQLVPANDPATATISDHHTPDLKISDSKEHPQSSNFTMEDSTLLSLPYNEKRVSIRETQTDEEIMAIARDRCLQDYQVKRVHERRSGFLGTFGKRRSTMNVAHEAGSGECLDGITIDGSPTLLCPTRPPPSIPVASEPHIASRPPRNFTSSLKGRFVNAFRRPSKTMSSQTSIPPQHVEAKDFQWTVKDYDLDASMTMSGIITAAGKNKPADSLMIDNVDLTHDTHTFATAQKNVSATPNSTARSRITSWTNSTVAGTSTLRSRHLAFDDESHEQEHPVRPATAPAHLPAPGEVPRVRKVSSFFGRPVHNRLRKSSKADLRDSSEQSKGLFDALQKRIRPKRSVQMIPAPDAEIRLEATTSVETFTRAMLPSQSRQNLRDDAAEGASITETVGRRAPTVRTVTPDQHVMTHSFACDVFSPIEEVASPLEVEDRLESEPILVRPNRHQLMQRMQRAKNRWRDTLDAGEQGAPRRAKGAVAEGLTRDIYPHNPYVLTEYHPYDYSPAPEESRDLPHHAQIPPALHASHSDDVRDKHSFLHPKYPPPPPPPAFTARTPPARLYNPSRRNGQLHTYPRVDLPSAMSGRATPSPTPQARTDPRSTGGGALMSPSVYSRATDGASLRVASPPATPEVSQWKKYDMAEDTLDKTPTAALESAAKVVKRKESKVTFTADVAGADFRNKSDHDAEALGGSIITVTGREVKRYRVPFSKAKTTTTPAESNVHTSSTDQLPGVLPKHKVLTASRKPSLEWRRWLSNELNIFRFGGGGKGAEDSKGENRKASAASEITSKLADENLAGTAASGDVALSGDQQASKTIFMRPDNVKFTESVDVVTSSSNEKTKSSDERLPHSRHSSYTRIRSRATSRSSSSGYMNERYPMVVSAMDVTTAASMTESRRRGPKKAASFADRTTPPEPVVSENEFSGHDDAFIEMDETDDQVYGADVEELPRVFRQSPPHVVPAMEAPMPGSRTRSALELRVRYSAAAGQVSKALEIRKTRQETMVHPALRGENSSSETASQTVAEQTQIVHADHASPGSPPPQNPLRIGEDPTLMRISAGPYADDDASDLDVHVADYADNKDSKGRDFEVAGAKLNSNTHREAVRRHSANTADHVHSPSKTFASGRQKHIQRMSAPGGVKISEISLLPPRPQHSAQRRPTPIAADVTLERTSSSAWLKGDTPPMISIIDSRTAPKAKVSIGENMRPSTANFQKQSPIAVLAEASQDKLHSLFIEDSKDRKPSPPTHHIHYRRSKTLITPHGHA